MEGRMNTVRFFMAMLVAAVWCAACTAYHLQVPHGTFTYFGTEMSAEDVATGIWTIWATVAFTGFMVCDSRMRAAFAERVRTAARMAKRQNLPCGR
jgi:hypothetical protein